MSHGYPLYYAKCTKCGHPFALRNAHIGADWANWVTTCPKCHHEVAETSDEVMYLVDESLRWAWDAAELENPWGTFTCDACGGSGIIQKDVVYPSARKRLTSFCRECGSWSRWLPDELPKYDG